MLIQRGYRRRLASKHGEYATKEEFEQLVTFQAKTLPTVLGEWKRLHEQAQGSSGAGPVGRSSSEQYSQVEDSEQKTLPLSAETKREFQDFLMKEQDLKPPPHRYEIWTEI